MTRPQHFWVGQSTGRKGCFISFSERGTFLMIAGAVGLALSLALLASLVINALSLAVVCALVVYGAGAVAMTIITSAYPGHWSKLPVRLIAPLPAAVLVWFALRAIGL